MVRQQCNILGRIWGQITERFFLFWFGLFLLLFLSPDYFCMNPQKTFGDWREENSTYVKPWIILTRRNYFSFTYWATIYSRGSPSLLDATLIQPGVRSQFLATLSMNQFTWEFPSGVFITGGPRKQCWWWTETFPLSACKVRRVGRDWAMQRLRSGQWRSPGEADQS